MVISDVKRMVIDVKRHDSGPTENEIKTQGKNSEKMKNNSEKFWMNLKNSEPSQPESEELLTNSNKRKINSRSSQDQYEVKLNIMIIDMIIMIKMANNQPSPQKTKLKPKGKILKK